MKFFLALVTQTDEARRAFENHPVVMDAVAQGLSQERYQKFLLELYHLVWHFNTVSAAATSRLADSHRQVRYFLYQHMQEEKGHEDWVLNDLAALGVNRDTALAYAPSADTLALTGYNYWAADRKHPCSVLGMLYVLEVIASVYGGPLANAQKERLLLQGELGVSFINSHATLDAEHMRELREIANTLDDAESQASIVESALVNFHHFTRIVQAL
ncbi:MAG: iron-containing redox enzyme family protein [Vitreoscilla sp.]|nr:iron-containing redox enzyme family protein [Burkholderiales bacterium]MBP6337866.1 iron-containing redox enzyme family protein [Vitreoscilla sp.]MBP6674418.1 iron-containing redox enzyme family protein [Vitreoscilla sp.]